MIPKKCPVGEPKKRTPKKNLEGVVVKECLALLNDLHAVLYVERRNTGSVDFEGGGHISFGCKGAADIWCVVNVPCTICNTSVGVHVEIECKRADGKGRLSVAQKKFKDRCATLGIPYLVVTSAQNILDYFRGTLDISNETWYDEVQ